MYDPPGNNTFYCPSCRGQIQDFYQKYWADLYLFCPLKSKLCYQNCFIFIGTRIPQAALEVIDMLEGKGPQKKRASA